MFYVSNFANLQYSHTVMLYVHPNFANLQYSVLGTPCACTRFWLGAVLYANTSRYTKMLTVVLADLNVSLCSSSKL